MIGLMQYPEKIIDFYYFSGTGNTLLIVKEMVKLFKENKFDAKYYRIEQTDPNNVDTNHIIGLGFPVAAQGTYPFVWQFIKNLPYAHSTPLFGNLPGDGPLAGFFWKDIRVLCIYR